LDCGDRVLLGDPACLTGGKFEEVAAGLWPLLVDGSLGSSSVVVVVVVVVESELFCAF